MEFVEPIKTKGNIKAMIKYLKNKNLRDWALFVLGINSAMRVSDLLRFSASDIVNEDGTIKELIKVKEKKTGKTRTFFVNEQLTKVMTEYLEKSNISKDDMLFPSRIGENQAITRQYMHIFLKEAAKAVGVKENVSTHSCRKTFGYWAYKEGTDITLLMKIFNHSDPSTTLRYIGITQEDINDVFKKLKFG